MLQNRVRYWYWQGEFYILRSGSDKTCKTDAVYRYWVVSFVCIILTFRAQEVTYPSTTIPILKPSTSTEG